MKIEKKLCPPTPKSTECISKIEAGQVVRVIGFQEVYMGLYHKDHGASNGETSLISLTSGTMRHFHKDYKFKALPNAVLHTGEE